MKVLLIYPYPLFDRSQEEDIRPVPIGVYYVGAVLKEAGYDVEILNWFKIHKTPERIGDRLAGLLEADGHFGRAARGGLRILSPPDCSDRIGSCTENRKPV